MGKILAQELLTSPIADKNGLVTWVWQKYFQGLAPQIASFIQGTHAARLAALASSYVDGSIFQETDRGLVYLAIKGAWVYVFGTMLATQNALPTDLGPNDGTLLLFVTDFAHLLQWNGSGWQWAPGELGSDMIVQFLSGPNTVGWQACDGSAGVSSLQPDGTLAFVTVPSIAGSWYRQ